MADVEATERRDFYVYGLFRPVEDGGEIFYVGKGCRDRIKIHGSVADKGNKAKKRIFQKAARQGKVCGRHYLHIDLNEKRALELEKELIRQYGRRNLKTGPLVNITGGGEGISRSPPQSAAAKAAAAEQRKKDAADGRARGLAKSIATRRAQREERYYEEGLLEEENVKRWVLQEAKRRRQEETERAEKEVTWAARRAVAIAASNKKEALRRAKAEEKAARVKQGRACIQRILPICDPQLSLQ